MFVLNQTRRCGEGTAFRLRQASSGSVTDHGTPNPNISINQATGWLMPACETACQAVGTLECRSTAFTVYFQ